MIKKSAGLFILLYSLYYLAADTFSWPIVTWPIYVALGLTLVWGIVWYMNEERNARAAATLAEQRRRNGGKVVLALIAIGLLVALLAPASAMAAESTAQSNDSFFELRELSCKRVFLKGYSVEQGDASYIVWVAGDQVDSDTFNVNKGFSKTFHWSPMSGQVNYLVQMHLPDGTEYWDAKLLDC